MVSSGPRSRACAVVLALLVGTPTVVTAQLTETQKTSARGLMDEGHARRAKGDHKGALESFRAAHALVHAARSGVEVGRSLLDLGRLVEAREAFRDVLAMPAPPNEAAPSVAARAEAKAIAADLDRRIPVLTVTVTGTTSARITIDGREAKGDTQLDPGEHVVKGSAEKEERTATVSLAEGDHKTITLDFSAPAKVVSAPPRTVLWVGLAVTGAGVAVGSITGALAFSTASSAKSGCERSQCPPPHDDLFASRRYGTISNVAFVVAGIGAVVSVVGFFSSRPERPSVSPAIGLGTIGVVGSF